MLTPRQRDLLAFIDGYIRETGTAPSLDEIGRHMGTSSRSSPCAMLIRLEERGFIRRRHSRARAIEVIKLPEALCDYPTDQFIARLQRLMAA